MAEDKEDKVILEREYIVPLRKRCLRTPYFRRTKRAMKVLKEFIAKHMKTEDRRTDMVKIDMYVNHEVNFRNEIPPNKIKVRCKKMESGIVKVELVDIPQILQYKIDRLNRIRTEGEKKADEKKQEKAEVTKEEKKEEATTEEKKEVKAEKDKSVEVAEKIHEKEMKREMKHEVKTNRAIKQAGRTASQDSSKN